ncbi:MAG: autoinducer binding domain-containing protein, partial [Gemmobacter sp.]|nr:autoinducer binding domain-containing protein [Gemmobacter sp.]
QIPTVDAIKSQLTRLSQVEGWRYAIGLRVRFANPTILYNTYPDSWLTEYAALGLRFSDPTIRWGMSNFGVIDWADIAIDDPDGVMIKAQDHGLKFGIAVSVGDTVVRSMGFFARSDRSLTPEETDLASDIVDKLHLATDGLANADEATLDKLRGLNV